ncbi:MAG TPA: AAA domain-containing protein [Ktedonobacteraceae bacterium]|nr:AAA domain-containing protein [Ktedonobacteraceae bacterium]
MVLYDVKTGKPATGAHSEDCFLCILDTQPCTVKKLEGYIIHAQEVRSEGEVVPFVTINLGTELAALTLTRYYRSLIQGLVGLGSDLHKRKLKLRVYHLPPAIRTTESKGRLVRHYRANDHTLAILEPDTVLNITDLSHAEYCARQYLLQRLIASPPSVATMRGNLVHYSFKEMLKDYTGGKPVSGSSHDEGEGPLVALHRHFQQALESSGIELALANASPDEIRADAAPHLESLATWFQKQYATLWDMPDAEDTETGEQGNENGVRAETFLLAPEIGLRGRLDLFWKQKTGRQRLLELKTGGAKGELPNASHRWQVQGYHALLAVRRNSRMKKALATLLYSGTPGEAQDFRILFTARQFQRVIENRNILVLSHVTGKAPAPPGPSRCTKCAMLEQCTQVSTLLDWRPPEPEPQVNSEVGTTFISTPPGNDGNRLEQNGRYYPTVLPQDRIFFSIYYELLHLEEREIEKQQAMLWKMAVQERIEQGSTINDIQLLEREQTEQGEWEQTFACINTSELREGDEILLSNGDPISGEVVTGTIISISAEQVRIWTRELIAHPRLIDRYDNSIVHIRTLQNLMRWLQTDRHLRELVAGSVRPRFDTTAVTPRTDFNAQQNLAVEQALRTRDYLLIHGPPGTGKTNVIAEIVKRLCAQGQRVMLAAFTNQAVDNMLKRLDDEGFHDYVRLGHERSTDESIKNRLLQKLVEQEEDTLQGVRQILRKAAVIASTTATWSSDKYDSSAAAEREANREGSLLQFDVAIIDEAGQLTVPAILGALRFAKRFILVGDEKQLPPLVLSKEAQEKGLSESLFEKLKGLDDAYINNHPGTTSACVPLTVQYRMNKWISHFASRMFYEGKLKPHDSVADARLELVEPATFFAGEPPAILRAVDPEYPVVFLDVRGEQEGIKMSNAEARAVREVVAGLLLRGIEPRDIGIIAPFRAQVANLRRHLLDEHELSQWPAPLKDMTIREMSIDTVDRFQGGEREVIIISFATTTAPEIGSQLREHLTNPNRLNVALTRARKKLILVGSAPALEKLLVFDRLLAYCRELRTVIAYVPIKTR